MTDIDSRSDDVARRLAAVERAVFGEGLVAVGLAGAIEMVDDDLPARRFAASRQIRPSAGSQPMLQGSWHRLPLSTCTRIRSCCTRPWTACSCRPMSTRQS
jgi:hypothetical protein